jgi:HEAT repeat protein
MKDNKWRIARVAAVCIGVLLAVGHSVIAASESIPDEAALIGVLKSDAGWLEKQTACRSLRQIGTVNCIPALAALLPDEKLSHMARYALEPMPYPEAGQALRDALAKTEGMPKAGVIISIGARRDTEAMPLLVPLLKDPNMDIARTAAGALGRIATPEAANALMDFRSGVAELLRPALAEGLLAAAERFVLDGKVELAAPIYSELLTSSWPMHVRMGAFRGMAYAQASQAPQRLIEALSGNEPLFRDMAAQIIAETSGADATRPYAAALPKLPADGQAALLRGLADRGDPAARPEAAQCVTSSDKQVKLAAVKALGTLGSVEDVNALAGLLSLDDAEIADAAMVSLTTMPGKGVNPAIAAAVPAAPPAARARLLDLLANRRAEQAVPLAVTGLKDTDVSVRLASLRALAPLGTKEEVPAVLLALANTSDASERSAAEKALGAICSRGGDQMLPLVLDAMTGAGIETHLVLLRVLARIGGPKALETVLAALNDSDGQISDEAVRLLSEWTTLDAISPLLTLASSTDLSRQVLGLRGYIRLAGIEPSAEIKKEMLTTAIGLARRPDEMKLVLGAWATLPTQQSLDILRPNLDDPAVQNEAALAIIAVASELGKQNENAKPRAIEALKAVLEKCKDTEIRQDAQEALASLQ